MKNIKLYIGIIIGVLISSVGVYALNINARDTAYDNTNSGSSATNMQDAIDDLYEKAGQGSTVIDCGSYNRTSTSQNVDIKSFYENYQDLTADNIMVVVTSIGTSTAHDGGWGGSANTSPRWTYSNGIVTVSNLYATSIDPNQGSGLRVYVNSFKVYIIV